MLPTPQTIVLIGAATVTALMAGLFYAYTCSVMPGLSRLSDPAFLAAMQSINRAILNPIFFVSFVGAVLLLPLSTYLQYGQPTSGRFWYLLAATVVYLAGVMGVTVMGNIPLNEALDAFDIQSASVQEIAAQRARFEGPWTNLNIIRTLASTLTLVLVLVSLSCESGRS